jgi:hypothetical protein
MLDRALKAGYGRHLTGLDVEEVVSKYFFPPGMITSPSCQISSLSLAGRHGGGRPAAGEERAMKRQVSYQWRLREMMAAHGMLSMVWFAPV